MSASGFTRARVGLSAFVRWWWDELYDVARDGLGRLFPRWFAEARVYLSATGGTLVIRQDSQDQSWPLQRRPDGTWDVASDARPVPSTVHGIRAIVALPNDAVLTYELSLPARAERGLRGLVALNVEKAVPLAARELAIDQAVTSRDSVALRIGVRVWVARTSEVSRALASALAFGVRPARVGLQVGGDIVANFPTGDPLRGAARGRLNRWLIASLVALGVVALGLELGEHVYERTLAARELERLQPQAAAAQKLRDEVDRRQKIFGELTDALRQPDAVEALTALTAALPDEGWAQTVEIQAPLGKPVELRIAVETGAKNDVLEALQRAPRLESAVLASTVAGEAGRERMELIAHLRGDNRTVREAPR